VEWVRVEIAAYWALFVATFLAVATWESFRPRRSLSAPAERRWGIHGLLLLLSGVVMTAVVRVTPVVVAVSVADSRFGILNRIWMPFPIRCLFALLLLDLAQYGMHRLFHAVPMLWRVHEVHHSDADYDVSTAARFHPFEVVGIRGGYVAVVALVAPPPVAVLAAELLAGVINLFAHANASLPRWAERALRVGFITPDLHRIHHSQDIAHHSRNFGQAFPFWDRLFGTYLEIPTAGEDKIVTGIRGKGDSLEVRILLAAPFQTPRSET